MTFDNEFLLVHCPKRGSDYLYKRKVVTMNGSVPLEKVIGSYYAQKVARTAYNFRSDWIIVQCGKYGKIEIYRK